MLTITRTIYENYLHILFAVREQEKHAELLRAQVGREIGTHSFARTKTGKIDRRYLVERETGRVTPASYSTFKMACCSPWAADRNLYELLYGSLSEFTHPHPVHVARFFDESGVNFRNRFQTWEANLLANAAALMTADALLNVGGHPRRPRADVLALLRHFKSAFSHYMGLVPTDAMGRDDLDLIWRRVKRLGQKWAGQESASEDAT